MRRDLKGSMTSRLFYSKIQLKIAVAPYYDEYGILTVNVYDFLLDPSCIEK